MIITGDTYTDNRGTLSFVNDFRLDRFRRFYMVTHPDTKVTRAWQGHQKETKAFFVTKGKFVAGWVKIDNWEHPSKELTVNTRILSAENPAVLIIEPGHANGFRALEEDSVLLVFSDLLLEESALDMFRFDVDYWKLG